MQQNMFILDIVLYHLHAKMFAQTCHTELLTYRTVFGNLPLVWLLVFLAKQLQFQDQFQLCYIKQ